MSVVNDGAVSERIKICLKSYFLELDYFSYLYPDLKNAQGQNDRLEEKAFFWYIAYWA